LRPSAKRRFVKDDAGLFVEMRIFIRHFEIDL
jgi:hypothetical protein